MPIHDCRRGVPARVLDGAGNEVKDVVHVDTDTGEVTQFARDEDGGKIVRGSGRQTWLETQLFFVPLPVRVQPMHEIA